MYVFDGVLSLTAEVKGGRGTGALSLVSVMKSNSLTGLLLSDGFPLSLAITSIM